MTALTWDQVGERIYETGVDHGVLYIPTAGVYDNGVAWNGLTGVTESPSGAEATATYADNIKYLNLISQEQFGATITAYTYPDEFGQFDGTAEPQPGVKVGQQTRKVFGLCYRTLVGNDVESTDAGYKLHLVYGCQAAPSEKAYATVNDTPEAIEFSWEVSTTPVPVTGLKPTATLTIDSTKVDSADLAALEDMLYGTVGTDPQLPAPDTVIALFAGSLTVATPTEPTYNAGTGVITIPTITGVTYYMDGNALSAGAQPAITENKVVTARANPGYIFPDPIDDDWFFDAP